jgi:hypothetical protein
MPPGRVRFQAPPLCSEPALPFPPTAWSSPRLYSGPKAGLRTGEVDSRRCAGWVASEMRRSRKPKPKPKLGDGSVWSRIGAKAAAGGRLRRSRRGGSRLHGCSPPSSRERRVARALFDFQRVTAADGAPRYACRAEVVEGHRLAGWIAHREQLGAGDTGDRRRGLARLAASPRAGRALALPSRE